MAGDLPYQRADLPDRVLRRSRDRAASTDPQEVELDVGGVALGVLLMLAITFAFIEAGRSGADPPVVIGAAAAAVVLVGLFAAVERRRGSATLLPLSLSRSPAFTVADGAAGA